MSAFAFDTHRIDRLDAKFEIRFKLWVEGVMLERTDHRVAELGDRMIKWLVGTVATATVTSTWAMIRFLPVH